MFLCPSHSLNSSAVRWKARMRTRIGEYGNRRRDTLPYPVYVTNNKHWSPGVRDPASALPSFDFGEPLCHRRAALLLFLDSVIKPDLVSLSHELLTLPTASLISPARVSATLLDGHMPCFFIISIVLRVSRISLRNSDSCIHLVTVLGFTPTISASSRTPISLA